MWEAEKGISGGNVRLPGMGDPMIEKWEAEIEQGGFPDLTEGLPPALKEKALKAVYRREKELKEVTREKVEKFIKEYDQSSAYMKAIKQAKDFEFSDTYGTQSITKKI